MGVVWVMHRWRGRKELGGWRSCKCIAYLEGLFLSLVEVRED